MQVIPAFSYGLITQYRPRLLLTILPRLCPGKDLCLSSLTTSFVRMPSGFRFLVAGQSFAAWFAPPAHPNHLPECVPFVSDCSARFSRSLIIFYSVNKEDVIEHYGREATSEII